MTDAGRSRGKGLGASLLSGAVSAALLIGLYRSIDARAVGQALQRTDKLWLVISVGMILPITVLRAIRFRWVAPPGALSGVAEALRLTLVASALNVVVPAKAGDLIKSFFIARRGHATAGVSLAIIVYERLCDVFALMLWCMLAWIVARPDVPGLPPQFWIVPGVLGAACGVLVLSERLASVLRALAARAHPRGRLRKLGELAEGWPDLLQLLRGRRRWIVPFSLLLWLAHLGQMWLFTFALSRPLPFAVCASLSALALMAGQVPLTVAGLGTRDVALVVLLARYMPAESAAAMGILVATRGLLPPLAGLPIMRPYLTTVIGEARRWSASLR